MVVKFTQSRGEYLACPNCKAEVAKTPEPQPAGS
jgi:hypothetical protein